MKAYKFGKVVFDKELKEFAGSDEAMTEFLEDALIYDKDLEDKEIISFYDSDYQDKMEIWKVRITIETI